MKRSDLEEQATKLAATLQQFLAAKGIKVEVEAKLVGRPRSADRCPCGEMTAYRAAKRGHVCKAKEKGV